MLDNLTITLCICIGTGVPWLMAIHSDFSARQLIGNTLFGMAGTVLAAFAFDWISPTYSILALISAGPLIALLACVGGQAAKRAILSRLSRPSSP